MQKPEAVGSTPSANINMSARPASVVLLLLSAPELHLHPVNFISECDGGVLVWLG